MMQVQVRLRPSAIQGLGIFAARRIPKGTIVWRYQEPVDSRLYGCFRPSSVMEEFMVRFGYQPPGADYVELCGDVAAFFNHSDDPNCASEGDETRAIRDIEPGEELTENYRSFNSLPMPFLEQRVNIERLVQT